MSSVIDKTRPSLYPASLSSPISPIKKAGLSITGKLAKAALTIGGFGYQYVPGAKSISRKITQSALTRYLPQKNTFCDEIHEARQRLQTLTDAPILGEYARVIASIATQYLTHQITHVTTIDPALRSAFSTHLLYNKTTPGLLGDTLKKLCEKDTSFISEIIEVNLLHGLETLIKNINVHTNPFWLVEYVQELMIFYKEDQKENVTPSKAEQIQKLSSALLQQMFPEGPRSFLLPEIPGKEWIKQILYSTLETGTIPQLIHYIHTEITSDYYRDLLVLEFFKMLQKVLSDRTSTDTTTANAQMPRAQYHQQARFTTEFVQGSLRLIAFLDTDLHALMHKFNITQYLTKHAPLIIKTLQELQIGPLCNKLLQETLPLICEGDWKHSRFQEKPYRFFTTEKQYNIWRQQRATEQEKMRQETCEIIEQIPKVLSKLSFFGINSWLGVPSKKQIIAILKNGHFLERVQLSAQIFLAEFVKFILRLFYFVFGKQKVLQTGHSLFNRLSASHLSDITLPAEQFLLQKITSHTSPL